jgi:hypothetical protein
MDFEINKNKLLTLKALDFNFCSICDSILPPIYIKCIICNKNICSDNCCVDYNGDGCFICYDCY